MNYKHHFVQDDSITESRSASRKNWIIFIIEDCARRKRLRKRAAYQRSLRLHRDWILDLPDDARKLSLFRPDKERRFDVGSFLRSGDV